MKHRPLLLFVLLAVFLFAGFFLLRPDPFDDEQFQSYLQQVSANDLLATQVFGLEDSVSDEDYLASISGGVKLYQESSQLLDQALALENIPTVQKELAEDIGQYVDLRTDQFMLLKESVRDNDFLKLNEFALIGERIDALEIYQQGSLLESIEKELN